MKKTKNIFAVWMVLLLWPTFSFAQWTSINPGPSGNLEAFYFSDATNGFCSSLNTLVQTTDGGNSWTMVPSNGMNDLDFAGTTGFATGDFGNSLFKTTNGGSSWNSLFPPDITPLHGVSVINATTAFVSGEAGVVWKTTNGTNFTACNLPFSSGTAIDLQFLSASTGCVLFEPGDIYRTVNAGSSWTLVYDGTGFLFRTIYFVDANNGYAVGTGGRIFKSANGGVSWTQQTSGTNRALNGVHFFDANNGIVCGDSGLVLTTINGGTTWSPEPSTGTTHHLLACYMLSSNSAIACGESSTIIKNTNLAAINENESESYVSIFPNPTLEVVNVSSEKEISAIRIFNPLGELIYGSNSPFYKTVIEIPGKTTGTYLVEFEISGKKYAKKLIRH